MSEKLTQIINTLVGNIAVSATDLGICTISFINGSTEEVITVGQRTNVHLENCCNQLKLYFEGNLKVFDISLDINGTEYQKKVWEEMAVIPYGETRSYGDISKKLGYKNGARAVGRAANTNKIPIIIPCHRVIGASGELTGFASGLDVKVQLLNLEAGRKSWSLDGNYK